MLKVKPGQMHTPHDLRAELIAPCGMNCGLCMRYLRANERCEGCRAGDEGKAKSCLACAIRNCEHLSASKSGFCFECEEFPCARLKRLDARYRAKYRMSMLENLHVMREEGVDAFLEHERERWACPACGALQCVHTIACIYCGQAWG